MCFFEIWVSLLEAAFASNKPLKLLLTELSLPEMKLDWRLLNAAGEAKDPVIFFGLLPEMK